mmetsp:Transcript_24377/g.67439  ORF Transcript_24377/g.67439 Transcript_24377/m.67439 type:complete len:123 (-) Transcript_24377:56-424(-)
MVPHERTEDMMKCSLPGSLQFFVQLPLILLNMLCVRARARVDDKQQGIDFLDELFCIDEILLIAILGVQLSMSGLIAMNTRVESDTGLVPSSEVYRRTVGSCVFSFSRCLTQRMTTVLVERK